MRRLLIAVCLGCACAGYGLAQDAAAISAGERRRLLEQKVRLVETLLASPAARKAADPDRPDQRTPVEHSRRSLEAAKAALAEDRLDEAGRAVDEALKSAAAASRRLSRQGDTLSESAQRSTFQDLREQIATYRASVAALSADPRHGASARELLARIDAQSAESARLAEAGRWGDANRRLAETYQHTAQEISRLRAGQEVVLALKFETPADELAYEQRRFKSNEIMIDRLIGEGRADRQGMVDAFVRQGRALQEQAEARARAGDAGGAVPLMEQANAQLNRALQAMGVPVF